MNTSTTQATPPAGAAGVDDAADTPEQDPVLESFGRFRDDPFWDEMQESIRRHRREMDAEWELSG